METNTTADVEKIALLKWKLGKNAKLIKKLGIKLQLAHKALEAWRQFPHQMEPHCDECARASIRAEQLTDAALTGTGEKHGN